MLGYDPLPAPPDEALYNVLALDGHRSPGPARTARKRTGSADPTGAGNRQIVISIHNGVTGPNVLTEPHAGLTRPCDRPAHAVVESAGSVESPR